MHIQENIQQIKTLINTSCIQANRKIDEVKLLAVSKTKPVTDILQAYQTGQTAFGENYVQEGVEKIQYFQAQKIHLEWHFIGPLQSNKTRLVAEYFDWVESLDRLKIAERLSQQRPTYLSPLQVLIQVNIDNEITKSGIPSDQLIPFAQQINDLPNLQLRGLMTIPAETQDTHQQKQTFEHMLQLFRQLQQQCPEKNIDTLSMGMSNDMQQAILCGSTQIRVGSAIFGSRS